MEKYGMYTVIAVNVQNKNIGMVGAVLMYLNVMVGRYWIVNIDVYARKNIIGMGNNVHINHVMVVSCGLVLDVCVQFLQTGMAVYVYNV